MLLILGVLAYDWVWNAPPTTEEIKHSEGPLNWFDLQSVNATKFRVVNNDEISDLDFDEAIEDYSLITWVQAYYTPSLASCILNYVSFGNHNIVVVSYIASGNGYFILNDTRIEVNRTVEDAMTKTFYSFYLVWNFSGSFNLILTCINTIRLHELNIIDEQHFSQVLEDTSVMERRFYLVNVEYLIEEEERFYWLIILICIIISGLVVKEIYLKRCKKNGR